VKNKLRVINDVKDNKYIYTYMSTGFSSFYKNLTLNVPDDGEWENNNLYSTNAKHLGSFYFYIILVYNVRYTSIYVCFTTAALLSYNMSILSHRLHTMTIFFVAK